MKFTNIMLSLALIGTLSLSAADDTVTPTDTTTQTTEPTTIDAQIAAIQSASPQDRVTLMNDFKEQLAAMNDAERAAAIAQLQSSMQAVRVANTQNSTQAAVQMRSNVRTHAQEMQLQTNEQATQMQNMNQNRVADQFMNSEAAVPGAINPIAGGATPTSPTVIPTEVTQPVVPTQVTQPVPTEVQPAPTVPSTGGTVTNITTLPSR